MTTLVETAAWLVDIPSETGSEERIRDEIACRLASMPTAVVRNSLVVGVPGPGKTLLVGHTDTVPLQGHVGARVEGDRLWGLGATDMKGGVAVIIHLLERFGPEEVAGVFYAGEEGPIAGNELQTVLADQPWLTQADAAVVMEPTDREVQAGCQGGVNATLVFEGEAAHSARPWLGVNAVSKAGDFLAMMHGLEAEVREVGGLEFKEVASITSARGGVANNIIPSRFEMNVNYRFAPDRTPEEALARLRELCGAADSLEVVDLAPPGRVDTGHPLFARLVEVSGAALTGKQGWTDVAQLSQAGIPAVNFGPGETSLAHKPGESVRIDDLDWVYDSVAAVLA